MRSVALVGVVIPARHDGANAAATTAAVLAAADLVVVPTVVVVVDDGGNGTFGDGLPADDRVLLVETSAHGPGHARTAGAEAFADVAAARRVVGEDAWIISVDADIAIGPAFVAEWIGAIEGSSAAILCAPAHFGALGGEMSLDADVAAAMGWMWSDVALYERFVGVINVGGCNHAVSVAVCAANEWYRQPTAEIGGVRTIVAGDDWDFGLRARMAGRTIVRVDAPVVVTSSRRIVADPVGFLAGRSYESAFEPVRDPHPTGAWPPNEPWRAVAARGRARLVAHFLVKALFSGIEPTGSLSWFLGDELSGELAVLAKRAPRLNGQWNRFRTELVELLFDDDVFGCCERIAQQIAGAVSS